MPPLPPLGTPQGPVEAAAAILNTKQSEQQHVTQAALKVGGEAEPQVHVNVTFLYFIVNVVGVRPAVFLWVRTSGRRAEKGCCCVLWGGTLVLRSLLTQSAKAQSEGPIRHKGIGIATELTLSEHTNSGRFVGRCASLHACVQAGERVNAALQVGTERSTASVAQEARALLDQAGSVQSVRAAIDVLIRAFSLQICSLEIIRVAQSFAMRMSRRGSVGI